MNDGAFRVNGCTVVADPSGALFWPDRGAVIVADLHLEKGSGLARRGALLPPYDSRATLRALEDVLERHDAKHVICLGDSFHDSGAPARLPKTETETIKRLAAHRAWTWIAGNHDPDPPADLGGDVAQTLTLGALVFRHKACPGTAAGEVSGHFHPKATVAVRGRRLTSRCFVSDGQRLMLPSFGAYTGGLDVLDPAISSLFKAGFSVRMLGREKVHHLSRRRLSTYARGGKVAAAAD